MNNSEKVSFPCSICGVAMMVDKILVTPKVDISHEKCAIKDVQDARAAKAKSDASRQ